ncbi:SurA N-terminal domain-containing protein [Paenibacillus popilliae]|uniref:peptidylprolyl isomerase n=1 Tax=Paenibacillus popilliae ATCC 14706 TaxID=1212764 RepID=M9M0T9_PAEPP|nr:SurA N-terminal domain-containing protein [Paenibacillus popilliae]GAC42479.1 parvulin-like peptidyl-prolyl isomerase [Paenibacillus popilliae ATCC 14706]
MTKEVKSLWGCILILCACILVLAGMLIFKHDRPSAAPDASAPPDSSTVVATVGGEKVTRQEWQEELERQYGVQVMGQMLTARAAAKEAEALGIEVSPKEVEQEIARQMRGYESPEAYFQAMADQLGMSPEQIRQDIHHRLLLEKIATHNVNVSEEELDRYWQDHWDAYESVDVYQLAHIVVPIREEAEDVLAKLKDGETFASLAGRLSVDEFSSYQEGRLGWIDANDPFFSPTELEAAREMEVGDISEPIEVSDGFAILTVIGKREAQSEGEAAIKVQARRDVALTKSPPLKELEEGLRKKYNAVVFAAVPVNG